MYTQSGVIAASLASVLGIVLIAFSVRAWLRSRVSPDEKERRRRQMISATGKMGDASLLDVHDDVLVYSYSVRGVEYTATQDISKLHQFLPAEAASMAGHVAVKYDARNPANSIVLAEEWTGFRFPSA